MSASWIDNFFSQVLADLGLDPTPWRLEFLRTWSQFETGGGSGGVGVYYNPLGTTQQAPGSFDAGAQSSVQGYPDIATGAAATAKTIANGFYSAIVDTLTNQSISNAPAVAANLNTWGTSNFVPTVLSGWSPGGATTSATIAPPAPVAPVAVPTVAYTEPAPSALPNQPTGGLYGILSSLVTPGQWNVVTALPAGVAVSDLTSQGWTVWAPTTGPNGDAGWWQQYGPGDYVPGNSTVGLLPAGMSLDKGRNPR